MLEKGRVGLGSLGSVWELEFTSQFQELECLASRQGGVFREGETESAQPGAGGQLALPQVIGNITRSGIAGSQVVQLAKNPRAMQENLV